MRAKDYAQALYEATYNASAEHVEVCLRNFYTLLGTRKHKRLLPKILKELAKIGARHERERTVTIVTAKPLDDHAKHEILHTPACAPLNNIPNKYVTSILDPSIVGGFYASSNAFAVDATYKQSLLKLYDTLTTNS